MHVLRDRTAADICATSFQLANLRASACTAGRFRTNTYILTIINRYPASSSQAADVVRANTETYTPTYGHPPMTSSGVGGSVSMSQGNGISRKFEGVVPDGRHFSSSNAAFPKSDIVVFVVVAILKWLFLCASPHLSGHVHRKSDSLELVRV
ncbi:uncharacterized protein BT62DRAFT_598580 [Guyanagaster necrorhizus]|uniref:Uncharacterized protein n=1 Tax=Guyanagaster necrorhizus TaxID=856835 RepID=A0A9P8AW03_9AGAR|nr:uncharacterized protein BT62DRAFT_598580 [Guyanagaster necrorhizus MCA 3950]KAG7449646.1 hypothetical protein BT62DRAFT_598580 [Guyanagaster necrorhizus MCA 3950]